MIMYEAEPIRDSQGNQWSKTELKCWHYAHQLFQVHYVIPKNLSTLEKEKNHTWLHTETLFDAVMKVLSQCRTTGPAVAVNPVQLYE